MNSIQELREERHKALNRHIPSLEEITKVENAYKTGKEGITLNYNSIPEKQKAYEWWSKYSHLREDIYYKITMNPNKLILRFTNC